MIRPGRYLIYSLFQNVHCTVGVLVDCPPSRSICKAQNLNFWISKSFQKQSQSQSLLLVVSVFKDHCSRYLFDCVELSISKSLKSSNNKRVVRVAWLEAVRLEVVLPEIVRLNDRKKQRGRGWESNWKKKAVWRSEQSVFVFQRWRIQQQPKN